MEKEFDLENIDLKNIPEENRIWVLLLLLLSFWGEKDLKKIEKLKSKIEKALEESKNGN